MCSRYFDVSLKNGMWRKIWIRDNEGILMMLKGNTPKNEAKEEPPRIELLTSHFLIATLTLIFFDRKV
jgi:hypothetical protein